MVDSLKKGRPRRAAPDGWIILFEQIIKCVYTNFHLRPTKSLILQGTQRMDRFSANKLPKIGAAGAAMSQMLT